MKQKIFALFCVALTLIALCTPSHAADDLYFLAINDTLPDLTKETAPIRVDGITYIPCSIFDSRVVGSGLGVSYTQDRNAGTVTLYNQTQLLEYNINAGTAFSYSDGKTFAYPAVQRNGLAYVPASTACRYFGLTCSFLITESGSLLRIKSGDVELPDERFVSAAAPILEQRKQNGAQEPPIIVTVPPAPPPAPNPKPTTPNVTTPQKPSEPVQEGEGKRIYLGIRVSTHTLPDRLLATLKQQQTKAVFFFPTETIATYDNELRHIVSEGHRVGLIPQGSNDQERATSLETANTLLEHILHQRTLFVLQTAPVGYLPWSSTVSVSGTLNPTAISKLEQRKASRLLLEGGISGDSLSSVLSQLKSQGYELRAPRETDY